MNNTIQKYGNGSNNSNEYLFMEVTITVICAAIIVFSFNVLLGI
jgi:hypothetical protein